MSQQNANLLLEFLSQQPSRVTSGYSWLIADVDGKGEIYFTVYYKHSYKKQTKQLYEGHSLADALWCLEHEQEYK